MFSEKKSYRIILILRLIQQYMRKFISEYCINSWRVYAVVLLHTDIQVVSIYSSSSGGVPLRRPTLLIMEWKIIYFYFNMMCICFYHVLNVNKNIIENTIYGVSYHFQIRHARAWHGNIQRLGVLCIVGYSPETHLKLKSREKSRSFITSVSVVESFWNVAENTEVSPLFQNHWIADI